MMLMRTLETTTVPRLLGANDHEIDLDRLVWDQEYRRLVKQLLTLAGEDHGAGRWEKVAYLGRN